MSTETAPPDLCLDPALLPEGTPKLHPPNGAVVADMRHRDVGVSSPESVTADVFADPDDETVTFVLDNKTASVVMHAVRELMTTRDEHAREVAAAAQSLPSQSYGASNRLAIAHRNRRLAERLRTVDVIYRREVDDQYWGH